MTELMEKIAGEITMSEVPGKVIRKWRMMFKVSQTDLANHMGIAPSVISDYEQGRRSPGTTLVKRIVSTLISIDKERGGDIIKRFTPPGQEGIIDIGEFSRPIDIDELVKNIDGEILNSSKGKGDIYGYTIIDSLNAIISMKSFDYLRIYGWSTERSLFFTGVEHGRSPLVAIRASPLTPAVVGYVKPSNVDELSLKLADLEGIPLLKTDNDVEELIKNLKKLQ
ncbi:MAG: helix-turn-helix domain-containing protein [Thermoplasmatota archaeon]